MNVYAKAKTISNLSTFPSKFVSTPQYTSFYTRVANKETMLV